MKAVDRNYFLAKLELEMIKSERFSEDDIKFIIDRLMSTLQYELEWPIPDSQMYPQVTYGDTHNPYDNQFGDYYMAKINLDGNLDLTADNMSDTVTRDAKTDKS